MGGIRRRLAALEDRSSPRSRRSYPVSRALTRFMEAVDDWRRDRDGLAPIDRPYTEEDRLDDGHTLRVTIPAYESEPGWKTGEAKAFLEDWEREVRERLERNTR